MKKVLDRSLVKCPSDAANAVNAVNAGNAGSAPNLYLAKPSSHHLGFHSSQVYELINSQLDFLIKFKFMIWENLLYIKVYQFNSIFHK